MRRTFFFALSLCLGLQIGLPARAAAPGYSAAERDFERNLSVDQRILAQILLIAGGYTNAVPTEGFNTHIFKAIKAFQADNSYVADGRLDKDEVDRLVAMGSEKLDLWGFRKVTYLTRPLAIWVPLGLGLDVKQTESGLHYKDRQGRVEVDLVSLPNASAVGVYRSLRAQKLGEGVDIHFEVFKDDWFVLSTTSLDGADHYYRYHQDGTNVTGFALEWNNAKGNVNGERIAVIMSGSLWSAMTGEPFIEPPTPQVEVKAEVPPTRMAPPVPPPPAPPKTLMSTGTGFFVTDDGYFITNAHVVEGCSKVAVKIDDGTVNDATRVATDAQNDLALLKVTATPARVVSLRLGARLGESVAAFGFPHADLLASSGNFTLGNITAMSGMRDDSRYLQMSAPVQAGNSGGPLLDSSGNLVGVVSAKLDALKVASNGGDLPQNVNFAVKSAMVAAFLDSNRVGYQTGTPAQKPLDPADIAEWARAMSGFVACK